VSREDKLQAEQIHHVLQVLGSTGSNRPYSYLGCMNQTRHLAQMRGKGQLSRSGEPDIPVTYDLGAYEESFDAGGGDFISGGREIGGRTTSKHRAVRGFSATNGEPSVLKLQDGRKLKILVLDSHGSVLGTGGFFE
jgi:hypothetical protein